MDKLRAQSGGFMTNQDRDSALAVPNGRDSKSHTASDLPSNAEREIKQLVSFWRWFGTREATQPGWLKLIDKTWTPIFAVFAAILVWAVPGSIESAATAGILPLAAIFIGMAFAWTGNALALIQGSAFKQAARNHKGGVREYAFTFQLATLALLSTVVLWGLGALGVFDSRNFLPMLYPATKWILFFVTCVSLRECWQVMLAAQQMLIGSDYLERIEKLPDSDTTDSA